MIAIITTRPGFAKQIKQLLPNNIKQYGIVEISSFIEYSQAKIYITDGEIPNTEVPVFVITSEPKEDKDNIVFYKMGDLDLKSFKNAVIVAVQDIIKEREISTALAQKNKELQEQKNIILGYEKALMTAQNIQCNVMTSININHFDTDIYYQAKSMISGDIFLAEEINNKIFFLIGDVTDHGYFAGIYGSSIYSIAKCFLLMASNFELDVVQWARCLQMASKFYKGTGTYQQLASATVLFCEIDKIKRTASFVSCGHGNEAPILIHNKEAQFIRCNKIYVPIGEFSRTLPSEAETISFEEGDALLFYTDGITEIFKNNDEEDVRTQYSSERLLASTEDEIKNEKWTPNSIINGICKDAESYSIGEGLDKDMINTRISNAHDDITIACVKWNQF